MKKMTRDGRTRKGEGRGKRREIAENSNWRCKTRVQEEEKTVRVQRRGREPRRKGKVDGEGESCCVAKKIKVKAREWKKERKEKGGNITAIHGVED